MNLKELSWWNTKDVLIDGYLVDLPEQLKKDILNYILNEPNYNSYYFDAQTKLNSKEVLDNITGEPEMVLDVDGDNIDVICEPSSPSTLNVVWPPGINPNDMRYETTTTNSSEKIDPKTPNIVPGHTANFLPVTIHTKKTYQPNQLLTVNLVENTPEGILAHL